MTRIFYKFAILIISFLKFLLTKRGNGFIYRIQSHLDSKNYFKYELQNKVIDIYAPNEIIKWRYDTIFSKEPETIEWINDFEKNTDLIFWDIGANVGIYSLYAALRHDNLKIVAFEPSTSNLRVLSRNISINNLENKIFINQLPLFDKENRFQIMREGDFVEGSALNAFSVNYGYDGKEFKPQNSYKLLGTSINFLLENKILNLPNYIKIDVDGIEDLILKGGDKFLNHHKIKSVLIEINENFKEQKNKTLDILKENNFKLEYKKHAKEFDSSQKYSSIYNYIFKKN